MSDRRWDSTHACLLSEIAGLLAGLFHGIVCVWRVVVHKQAKRRMLLEYMLSIMRSLSVL